MGKRRKRKEEESQAQPEFKVNPFAGLSVDVPKEAPPPPKPKPAPADRPAGMRSGFMAQPVVVRLEKKGRGGKMVTVIAGFNTEYELEMQQTVGNLRRHLGTGGTVKGDSLELQGDQRRKAADWLREQGFKVKGEV